MLKFGNKIELTTAKSVVSNKKIEGIASANSGKLLYNLFSKNKVRT